MTHNLTVMINALILEKISVALSKVIRVKERSRLNVHKSQRHSHQITYIYRNNYLEWFHWNLMVPAARSEE